MDKLQKVTIEITPRNDTLLPHSDGYLVYSAILNKLNDDISTKIHSMNRKINISSLYNGSFKYINNQRKKVFSDNTYTIQISIQDKLFDTVIYQLTDEIQSLQITNTTFDIISISVKQNNISNIYNNNNTIIKNNDNTTNNINDNNNNNNNEHNKIKIQFITPTIIKQNNNIEVFPHRYYLFKSLQQKWNDIVHDKYQIQLNQTLINNNCYTEYNDININRYNVRVGNNTIKNNDNTKNDTKNDTKNKKKIPNNKPAITGHTIISKNPQSNIWQKQLTLLIASQYIGIGNHISRGFGTISISKY